MSDEETPEATPSESGGTAVAVSERTPTEVVPAVPAIPMAPEDDPRVQQRKTRLWLPLLIPIGAVAVTAFFTLNISRVFIASSEHSHTPAIVIAIGITLAILAGATIIAALPNIRTTSLIVGMAGVMVVVLLAGSLVLGASLPESEGEAAFVPPEGPAINELEVDALPTLKFQSTRFEAPAGINLIKYVDKGGDHTLVFDKNAVPGFELVVPGGPDQSKVDLKQGDFVIYCTIPGHRAAGMEADLVVGPPPADPQAEPGTETPTTTLGTPGTSAPAQNEDPASQSSTGGSTGSSDG